MNLKPYQLGQIDEFELQNTSKEDFHTKVQPIKEQPLFHLNAIPKKIIAITIMLTILGITFLIIGLLLLIKQTSNYDQYLPLLFIGILMTIPGIYYSYKIIIFTYSRSRQEQEQIIQELPIDY
ncbi:unnamed protein product [Paramecium sonneborni]|uniref:Transmembrane protein 230 n=1 Tax=Paramecium sonneborni TaxID=65129 RepID=A0A8S1MZW7_9CILI|nr:unnamed protein product [Paramecium sonneborni]CAD8082437.1 unnamed protein product [Paramecium sonneborni]